ncbi:MAG: hypothetical protein HOK28_09970 [Deltaproteobacteria bacterium]|nr:hypothetical protein [Deltaproteobacteria bacterium]
MTRLIFLCLTILSTFSSSAWAMTPAEPACEMVLHKANLSPASDCFAIEVFSGIASCNELPMAMITNGCELPIEADHREIDDCQNGYCPFEGIRVEPGETLVFGLTQSPDLESTALAGPSTWDIEVALDDTDYTFELSYTFRMVDEVDVPPTSSFFGCRQVNGETTALWLFLFGFAMWVERRSRKQAAKV